MRRYHSVRCEDGIRILRDENRGNVLLILCPRLEEWIIEAARKSGVGLEDYGLPEEPDRLHEESRARLDKFEELVEGLRLINSARVNTLARSLNDCY